ncbi:MAG: CYTH domain-containing protein [Bacilli bacterium]
MTKENTTIFKTLLSKAEYNRLKKEYSDKPSNLQVNYYFDTPRFTLKASDIGLRVRKRDTYELTLKRKKGYALTEINEEIDEETFKKFMSDGIIPSVEITNELSEIIKGQRIVCYMSLSTFRITFPYQNGKISIDLCQYVDTTDYELEYETSNYEEGRKIFVEFAKEHGITYKKSQTKIKRAYEALKTKL